MSCWLICPTRFNSNPPQVSARSFRPAASAASAFSTCHCGTDNGSRPEFVAPKWPILSPAGCPPRPALTQVARVERVLFAWPWRTAPVPVRAAPRASKARSAARGARGTPVPGSPPGRLVPEQVGGPEPDHLTAPAGTAPAARRFRFWLSSRGARRKSIMRSRCICSSAL
jgi:hypothetical protein